MRVVGYECHNVKRVSDVVFDLEGRHLFIVGGKNGQGKSSSLDGLLAAICGRSGMDYYPEVLLKEGEEEGWVKVKLSGEDEELHNPEGITVELKLIRKRSGVVTEEFRIIDSDGDEAPEPRTLLKRLYNLKAFDPLSFARIGKKDRKALVEKLLDLDFSEQRTEYKRLYDERTSVNRERDKTKAQLDGIPLQPDVEEVSVSDLMAQLDSIQKTNDINRKCRDELERVKAKREQAYSSVDAIKRKIAALQEELAQAESSLASLSSQIEEESKKTEALVDLDTEEIRKKIREADAINRQARENKHRAEVRARYNSLCEESDSLTEAMKSIDDSVKSRTAAAKWPVPGMSIDADGLLLNGLPFEQASKREQIEASIDIGIALNPTLRLMVSQDGGALDDEAIETLDRKLEEADFQMIVEIATRSAGDDDLCAVVVKDGKIAKANPPRAKKKPAQQTLLTE